MIAVLIIFIIGMTLGVVLAQAYSKYGNAEIKTKTFREFKTTPNFVEQTVSEPQILQSEKVELQKEREEKASPSDWIKEDQIHVYFDKVEIDCRNCQWANFADTNSMDPVLDYGHNAIEIIPQVTSDIQVGDIVSYELDKEKYNIEGTIIHRVIEIGYDEEGWYAIFKGDNNNSPDPLRVRWDQIKRKVIAIIY